MKPIKPSENLIKQIEELERKRTKGQNVDSKIMLVSKSPDMNTPDYFIRIDYLKSIKNPDTTIKSALMVKGEDQPPTEYDEEGNPMPAFQNEPDSIDFGLEFWQIRNPDVTYFADKRKSIESLKDLIEIQTKTGCPTHRAKAELKEIKERYGFLMETRKVTLGEMRDRIKNNFVSFLKRD